MTTEYKVHPIFLVEADFEVLILEIPEEDLEDKLAYLAREKGQITRSFYEDFVIAATVANINQLLFHANQQLAKSPDLMKVREELVKAIYDTNPLLNPDILIINRNYVIKINKMSSRTSNNPNNFIIN